MRVSPEEQGDQGAGLEAQRHAIQEACTARGWRLVAIHQDVASGRSLEGRQGLATALQEIADRLTAASVATAHGGARWYPSTVRWVVGEGR